jgi:hypothetical protein
MRSEPTPWLRRSVLLANGLALLVGLILVVTAASLSSQTVLWTIAGVIGGALVSATVVTFTLGGISLTETITQVDSALLRGLQSVLSPVRETVLNGAISAYRWDCWLAWPGADDPYPDYAYQALRISYRIDTLPPAIRFVCAATRDDRVLEQLTADDYVFRWLIDDHLKVGDPHVFRIGNVRVDNEPLGGADVRTERLLDVPARIITYPVARTLRETLGHTLEFQVLVRKYVGDEARVRIQTQLFRTVTDAEFRFTVDPALGIDRLFTSASEVSALGVARGGSCESTFAEPFGRHAGIVRLPFPLQAGSCVAFTLDRTRKSTRLAPELPV